MYREAQSRAQGFLDADRADFDARRSELERSAFGLGSGPVTGSDAISMWDATDRVASLPFNALDEAAELMKRARLNGDSILEEAVAAQAYRNGWVQVVTPTPRPTRHLPQLKKARGDALGRPRHGLPRALPHHDAARVRHGLGWLRGRRTPAEGAAALTVDCAAAQQILTEVNDAATRRRAGHHPWRRCEQHLKAKQAELEELADASQSPFNLGRQVVADSVGRVRVAVLEGGDVEGAVDGNLPSVRERDSRPAQRRRRGR